MMEFLDRVFEYYNVKNILVVKQFFLKYMNLVFEKNKFFNFIVIEDEEEFVIKYIVDFFFFLKFFEEESLI